MILILALLAIGQILIWFGPETTQAFLFCDPGTIAAVAAPAVIGAFMPKPSRPGFEAPQGPNLYPEYQQKLLTGAFEPRGELYRQASEQAQANINRQLARRGLSGSGLAMATQSQAASDLANKFLESETERQARAYEAATRPELAAYQGRLGAAQGAFEAAKLGHVGDLLERERFLGGISDFGGELGRYGQKAGWFSGPSLEDYFNALPGTEVSALPGSSYMSRTGRGSVA